MRTAICDLLGIDVPVLAFSHCRDVVAAVSKAGGFGVLGGTSYTAEELDRELAWIDREVNGRPYGVDLVIPEHMESRDHLDPAEVRAKVPTEHVKFADELLRAHGITPPTAAEREAFVPAPMAQDAAKELLDVAFQHPIGLIASALGVPPTYLIDRAKAEGVVSAALVGAKEHAVKQVQAGVDVIVAQGTEAGGHCGEVSTMVLVPEVVDAVAPLGAPPVLAAGGIVNGRQVVAALALGAAGAWCGSVWLTTPESECSDEERRALIGARSRDTVRSRSRSGKPSRGLRSAWTDAWSATGNPDPLPMPLQFAISQPALEKVYAAAEAGEQGGRELATYFVGQGVGLLDAVRPAREVVYRMAEEILETVQHLQAACDD